MCLGSSAGTDNRAMKPSAPQTSAFTGECLDPSGTEVGSVLGVAQPSQPLLPTGTRCPMHSRHAPDRQPIEQPSAAQTLHPGWLSSLSQMLG